MVAAIRKLLLGLVLGLAVMALPACGDDNGGGGDGGTADAASGGDHGAGMSCSACCDANGMSVSICVSAQCSCSEGGEQNDMVCQNADC